MRAGFRPIIGITMGDAAGIGPEIVCKALSLEEVHRVCRPVVIGDAGVLGDAQGVARTELRIRPVERVSDASFALGAMDVLDLHNIDLERLEMGRPQPMAGKASYEYIAEAVNLALRGEIHGITTAPISKEALHMAGYDYPGHTEILAELTGTERYAMMFVAGPLKVILATIHVQLRRACDLIDEEGLLNTFGLAHETMLRFGVDDPRIAVAGLNPHAGEEGLFGDEEIRVIGPAVERARHRGLNIHGPLPADTLFYRAKEGDFDIVVAMYHDQGCIPIKLLGFEIGVNITVGLPITRTSVDHGTAYRRAGLRLGTGNPSSLVEALKIASQLSAGALD